MEPGGLYSILWRISDDPSIHLTLFQDLCVKLFWRRNFAGLTIPVLASVNEEPKVANISKGGPRVCESPRAVVVPFVRAIRCITHDLCRNSCTTEVAVDVTN